MSNTHLIPDSASEIQALFGDLLPAVILSTTWPAVPVASLTFAAFATHGYVRDGSQLVYVHQPAAPVTLTGADGTYWLGLHRNTSAAVSLWTRQPGTHYLWRGSATPPADPSGGLILAKVTVASGVITAVDVSQTSHSINHIAFGGPTGALAYAPSFVFDPATYRVGINTPTPLAQLHVAGDTYITGKLGVNHVVDPTYSIAAGPNSYFDPNVGIGANPPTATLDVSGTARIRSTATFDATARITGDVALGANFSPSSQARVHVEFPHATKGALSFRPTDNDTGPAGTVLFLNTGGFLCGSIAQTASAVSFNTSSDERLKSEIHPLTAALELLAALQPIAFRWQADGTPGVGFLAHELQGVLPEAVTGVRGAVWPDGRIQPQQVDLTKLVPWLVSAVQALLARVEALEAAQS